MQDLVDQRIKNLDVTRRSIERIPDKFKWILFLKLLEKRGYDVTYKYRDGEETDHLLYWNWDLEKGGAEPQIPSQAIIKKMVKKGKYYYEKKKVAVIRRERLLQDPNLETTLKIWDLVQKS